MAYPSALPPIYAPYLLWTADTYSPCLPCHSNFNAYPHPPSHVCPSLFPIPTSPISYTYPSYLLYLPPPIPTLSYLLYLPPPTSYTYPSYFLYLPPPTSYTYSLLLPIPTPPTSYTYPSYFLYLPPPTSYTVPTPSYFLYLLPFYFLWLLPPTSYTYLSYFLYLPLLLPIPTPSYFLYLPLLLPIPTSPTSYTYLSYFLYLPLLLPILCLPPPTSYTVPTPSYFLYLLPFYFLYLLPSYFLYLPHCFAVPTSLSPYYLACNTYNTYPHPFSILQLWLNSNSLSCFSSWCNSKSSWRRQGRRSSLWMKYSNTSLFNMESFQWCLNAWLDGLISKIINYLLVMEKSNELESR